jgi:hypothetical protein
MLAAVCDESVQADGCFRAAMGLERRAAARTLLERTEQWYARALKAPA